MIGKHPDYPYNVTLRQEGEWFVAYWPEHVDYNPVRHRVKLYVISLLGQLGWEFPSEEKVDE